MRTVTFNESEFKLVPVEPTTGMVIEGVNAGLAHRDEPYAIYAAMLAAAPTPPASALDDAKASDARWYVIDKTGQATLCADEQDARNTADESSDLYPGLNPHVAVQLAPVSAPAAGDARAWQGLTDAERDGYEGELVDYGTDFVSPLYSVVESIEKRLREKNAAQQGKGGEA